MGDSACLMQPFCYASGISNDSNQNINTNHALGQSVSFGRFMSESLAWEKWSSFSHNRYVEEAERYSKPGSVAQKKAFFEAHYKKLAAQKAAALLEQEKSDSLEMEEHDEAEVDNTNNSQLTSLKPKLVETSLPESGNKVDVTQLEKEQQTLVGNSMQNQLGDKDLNVKKGSTDPIVSNIATPMNNKASLRKKRSKSKSLHMSVKFAVIREINRLTSSVMRKFETTRVGSGSTTASKDRWTPITTPTKTSKNELQKHPSFSPLTEQKRNNMESPIISSLLSLRIEDRDACRKKERAQTKTIKPRLCFCFKPRQLPEFNKEGEGSNRGTKEKSLTPGTRVTSSVVQSKASLSAEILTTYENTSPNIQHGIQHERNY